MVIIIGNQKGGAGKSTLTLLLANYLTQARQRPVTVIDMDYQQSLAQKFERAKVLENAEPYAVVALALDQFGKEKKELKDNPEVLFLVDLPGKLDDDGLIEVFKAADLAICPFSYDEFSFESTVFFSLVLKKIKPAITIVYVPNRIKANVKYEILTDVNEQLLLLGEVTQAIPDRIDFQRANTFQTPDGVTSLLLPVFDHIYKNISNKFMSEIKNLVDQMRSKIKESEVPGAAGKAKKDKTVPLKEVSPKSHAPPEVPDILRAIRDYDNTNHKSLVHARFDSKTLQTMNQLKLAAGIDVTRLVAFAVDHLLQLHPELKTIIKQFFQKLDE